MEQFIVLRMPALEHNPCAYAPVLYGIATSAVEAVELLIEAIDEFDGPEAPPTHLTWVCDMDEDALVAMPDQDDGADLYLVAPCCVLYVKDGKQMPYPGEAPVFHRDEEEE